MDAENWGKVKVVLGEILNLEISERPYFLDKSDVSEEVRAEVESLLEFEDLSENLMKLSAVEIGKDFFDEESKSLLIGQTIGNYRIVHELGYGGMGAVYLAERVDGKFEQKVALKLLKRELNTSTLRRRFQQERQILSSLEHPNIARLLDAGTTDDKIPYLAMEYVEGSPIDVYCNKHQLDLNQRLDLFRQVCGAVNFAHRNLIVHRDLKPSNILVNKDGNPKLLDFGISKILSAEFEQLKSATVTKLGAMTLSYASPEQLQNKSVTTATDIYSLGVILYELLSGHRPFEAKEDDFKEIYKAVLEYEPSPPSAMIKTISKDLIEKTKSNSKLKPKNRPDSGLEESGKSEQSTKTPDIRRRMSYQVRLNAKSLLGDLDNIVLKALRKEPERRYLSAENFSEDIKRYLRGLPVTARPNTLSYRAAKFYVRNRISVLAGIFVFLSLGAGIAIAVSQANAARMQAQIASDARTAAELETRRALLEQKKAEKISSFMGQFISYANPRWDTKGTRSNGEAKVIEVLFDLSDKIDTEFPDNLDVRAELHHKFAEVFQRITKPYYQNPRADDAARKSIFHAHRALELRRQFYGERHELVAKDLAYLVWTREQEPAEAAQTMAQAIQMMRETNPKNLQLAFMLADYAGGVMLPNKTETKYDLKYPREQYHEIYLQSVTPPTSETKYQLGERYFRESLSILRTNFKEDNYAIFVTECYLAYSLAKQEKWTEFEKNYEVCKQGETKVKDKLSLVGMRIVTGWVKNVLAEKTK